MTTSTDSEATELSFLSTGDLQKYFLIKAPAAVVEKIERGELVTFRGLVYERAHICTDSETFIVRECETTNSLLISERIPLPGEEAFDSEQPETRQIMTFKKNYFQLEKQTTMAGLVLKDYLKKCQFTLGNDENQLSGSAWKTMKDLLEEVPFCRRDIEEGLRHLPVVEIDGTLRYLSRKSQIALVEAFVEKLDDQDLSDVTLDRVLREQLESALADYPKSCVDWLMRTFVKSDGSVDRESVIRACAVSVLEKEHELSLELFERRMLMVLPTGLDCDLSLLRGILLTKSSMVRGETVEYVNVDDMPSGQKERIELLLKIRSLWKLEDVQPYVADFCDASEIEPFLFRNFRVIKEGSVKRYAQKPATTF